MYCNQALVVVYTHKYIFGVIDLDGHDEEGIQEEVAMNKEKKRKKKLASNFQHGECILT